MHREAAILLAATFALLAPALGEAQASDASDLLAERADLEQLLSLAQERNPELLAEAHRVRAAGARAKTAGRLADPVLRYQLWSAPLSRPWDAEMHMLGVEQELPAWGSRDARIRAGQAEARLTEHARQARALEVASSVKRAYFELHRADREQEIRLEHVALAQRVLELARAQYPTGRVSQQDVLRAGVERSKLQADLASLVQARASAAALLNSLVGRPLDAPLGPAGQRSPPLDPPGLEALERALSARPELRSADAAIERSEASLDATRQEARWPAFMLGVDYMLNPRSEEKHGWAAMVSFNLPWLNPRHREQVEEAESTLAADRGTREALLASARFQLRDALARLRSARDTLSLIERELLPQARQSYEAAETAFASAQGDALGLLDAERTYLQVRIDRERALAQAWISLADLERAAGLPVPLE
ncbi:MAG: TolC family protein [Deltaproteobacteria bacterium]|nr:TolC family protein [Deltaproteobacteria bacterium]